MSNSKKWHNSVILCGIQPKTIQIIYPPSAHQYTKYQESSSNIFCDILFLSNEHY